MIITPASRGRDYIKPFLSLRFTKQNDRKATLQHSDDESSAPPPLPLCWTSWDWGACTRSVTCGTAPEEKACLRKLSLPPIHDCWCRPPSPLATSVCYTQPTSTAYSLVVGIEPQYDEPRIIGGYAELKMKYRDNRTQDMNSLAKTLFSKFHSLASKPNYATLCCVHYIYLE
jgi:hypothetical protein